jgi:uroporphyrinogen decarboxylase
MAMTSKERTLKTLRREPVDHIPVIPDVSQMIPARLTGKPFWDVFLYQDPPLWKTQVACAKYFGYDGLFNARLYFPFEKEMEPSPWKTAIVQKTDLRIVTQRYQEKNGIMHWEDCVTVYPVADPPTQHIRPISKIGLPDIPEKWEPLEGVKKWPTGTALLEAILDEVGDLGIVGVQCGTSVVVGPHSVEDYCENPDKYRALSMRMQEAVERGMDQILNLPRRPDFIACGGSGTMVWQSPDMVRELALPIIKRVTQLAQKAGIPSHIHSCGPERALVEMCANETDLTFIDPLEIPPMGDCDLAELKKLFGDKIILKGNIHTTNIMLRGKPEDVVRESKKAIDDAATGGGFILATGDQCGRDTPDENLFALVETGRTYGRS